MGFKLTHVYTHATAYVANAASLNSLSSHSGQVSAQGTSRLLMLKPSDGYAPEVAMFGGLSTSRKWSACCTASLSLK